MRNNEDKINIRINELELTVYVDWHGLDVSSQKCVCCGKQANFARHVEVLDIQVEEMVSRSRLTKKLRAHIVELVKVICQHGVPYCLKDKCREHIVDQRNKSADEHEAIISVHG